MAFHIAIRWKWWCSNLYGEPNYKRHCSTLFPKIRALIDVFWLCFWLCYLFLFIVST